jgi:hypothetical protein
MTEISTAAQAVLTALTQQEYGLDPANIPNEAGRMACVAAAALRAAAKVIAPEAMPHRRKIRAELLAIAAELETSTTKNR